MQLNLGTSMRTELLQVISPRMIQSMEILQLPVMALQERIEHELQENPVLELRNRAPTRKAIERAGTGRSVEPPPSRNRRKSRGRRSRTRD